jgi:hypothetical protein
MTNKYSVLYFNDTLNKIIEKPFEDIGEALTAYNHRVEALYDGVKLYKIKKDGTKILVKKN